MTRSHLIVIRERQLRLLAPFGSAALAIEGPVPVVKRTSRSRAPTSECDPLRKSRPFHSKLSILCGKGCRNSFYNLITLKPLIVDGYSAKERCGGVTADDRTRAEAPDRTRQDGKSVS